MNRQHMKFYKLYYIMIIIWFTKFHVLTIHFSRLVKQLKVRKSESLNINSLSHADIPITQYFCTYQSSRIGLTGVPPGPIQRRVNQEWNENKTNLAHLVTWATPSQLYLSNDRRFNSTLPLSLFIYSFLMLIFFPFTFSVFISKNKLQLRPSYSLFWF